MNGPDATAPGFTLVELLVAILIGLFVVAGFHRAFVAFAALADGQEQKVEMTQNLRLGIDHLAREIRRAGYIGGLTPGGSVRAGFLEAAADRLRITRDLGGGEDDGVDNDRDGQVDEEDEKLFGDGRLDDNYEDVIYLLAGPNANGSYDLQRLDLNGASDTIIENVDALNFVYLDENGLPLAWPGDGSDVDTTPAVGRLEMIRDVEIAMVVRTTRGDGAYRDTRVYRNGRDSDHDGLNDVIMVGPGDNFRRRLLTARIKCRNLGLL